MNKKATRLKTIRQRLERYAYGRQKQGSLCTYREASRRYRVRMVDVATMVEDSDCMMEIVGRTGPGGSIIVDHQTVGDFEIECLQEPTAS